MNGVTVNDNDKIILAPEIILEIVTLNKGVLNKGADVRARIRKAIEGLGDNERIRRAFEDTIDLPCFVPADRSEVHERAYGLAQCIGSAVGRAMQERGVPEHWQGATVEQFVIHLFCDAFAGDVGKDTDPAIDDFRGMEYVCLSAGNLGSKVFDGTFITTDIETNKAANIEDDVDKSLVGEFINAFLRGFRGEFEAEKSA